MLINQLDVEKLCKFEVNTCKKSFYVEIEELSLKLKLQMSLTTINQIKNS